MNAMTPSAPSQAVAHPLSPVISGARAGGVRAVNTAIVLSVIRSDGPLSRTDLIARSRLSKATVSVIVSDLLDRGLVLETGKAPQPRGRSRVLVEFNTDAARVIGVHVSDDAAQFALTDLAGTIREQRSIPLAGHEVEPTVDVVVDGVSALVSEAGAEVLGVGIGLPGVVDPDGRRIRIALSHGWHDVDFLGLVGERTGLSVSVANRGQVAALGEYVGSASAAAGSLLYVHLGDGVTGGAVLGGRLHVGDHGKAGEIGHVQVDPDGPRCDCGVRGCLSVVVGRPALLARLGKSTGDDWAGFVAAVQAGHRDEVLIAADAGRAVGSALAPMVAMVNPAVIAVGGPTCLLGAPLLDGIAARIVETAPTLESPSVVVGDVDSPARGAAMLWLERAGMLA